MHNIRIHFKEVRIAIPRKLIMKCLSCRGRCDGCKKEPILRAKLGQIEAGKNRLQHIESIIDRILLKT